MKVECLKEKLAGAVYKAEKITGKNLTLPVLSCILLEAKENTLIIKATNLDLGIEITIPVRVLKEGKIAVSGALFNNFISHLHTDKNITLDVVDNNLSIIAPGHKTVINTMNYEDFPSIPKLEKEASTLLEAGSFVKGLKSVWYSAAISSMKPELSSVYVYTHEDSLVFVATDSFRLAEKRIKIKKTRNFEPILIPFKNVSEIIRIFEEVHDGVEFVVNKNQISLSYDGLYLTSRIIDGTFPDYKQIIPNQFKTEVVMLKQDLINALKIANIFSDTFNQINLKAQPEKKNFELRTKNSNVGENNNNVEAVIKGEGIDINFNYRYIIDCFQSIDADSVTLYFNGLHKPMVIRAIGDKSFTYLVMPMNK